MRDVAYRKPLPNLETASFRACLASILELELDDVPQAVKIDDPPADPIVARWLAGLALGLAEVGRPGTFEWGGPWIARVRAPTGVVRFVVMFGHPSGVVWDPAGEDPIEHELIDGGFLVAAADIALARPAPAPLPTTTGVIELIAVSSSAGAPAQSLSSVRALVGEGLEGDRHVFGRGTFPSGLPGSAITLIEAEVCESFTPPLSPDDHRRNLVTRGIDLNGLVGHDFTIGEVRCCFMRFCEPCTVIDRYAERPILRALVHRGGVRADILTGGIIRTGDRIALA
jgi:hypothetical protein